MEQLLIIEDDIGLNQGLSKALKADDRQIISCHDLKAAREQLLCGSVSLVLLDINLPDGSGLELLREVKENPPYIPVILLTANDTDLDIVDGLERGADDYITKPFSLSVLRARVNTQLRKQASNHKNAPFHMDLFHFDFEAMTFYVGDSKVELSKTEQKLLRLLVENRGRTMTRGDLVDRIWTDGSEYVDENALSVTIKRLRDKLGAQKCHPPGSESSEPCAGTSGVHRRHRPAPGPGSRPRLPRPRLQRHRFYTHRDTVPED